MTRLHSLLPGLAGAALAGTTTIAVAAEAPAAVASIKPIHSLLAGVMDGVGEPSLLVPGGASPHAWSLRPSDAHAIEHADLVVWVGEGLESFLVGPIEALAADAYVLELSRAEGITLLRMREGGAWDEHGHDDEEDHGEDEHVDDHEEHDDDEHADEHRDDHDGDHDEDEHADTREDEDDHAHVHREDGHEHGMGEFNMHLWLDPANAEVIVQAMADALVRLDPEHESVYRANEAALEARLRALDGELEDAFAPVRDRGFIVFHDAWQYLDTRYGLRAVGSVTVSPDQAPGAARLAEVREKIVGAEATCVFAEPQFEPRLVRTLVEGTGARTGTLDPLGAALEGGPDLYFDLMRANAAAFRACYGI
ncbi:MAG: zinc ABC transporter substrate-binding protein [Immundisolibacterales bacterium]|nr:zinc ABC transporter substrate-binding protein [Immundisolibacterales bacterium]